MANHISSLKRVRQEARRTAVNRSSKARLRHQIRAMRRVVTAKDTQAAEKLLPATFSIIDRSAKIGLIKKNTAARYKSKLHLRLKALQDWVVERKLRIVPGVADVTVLGGKTKEFQAEINLDRMMAYGVTLPQIMAAISASNSNVGGRTIAIGEQSVNVRSIGVVTSMDDIGNIVLTQQGGVPVLVSDVAKVQIGYAPRLGLAGRDDKTDVVTGIVLMQKLEHDGRGQARTPCGGAYQFRRVAAGRRQDRAIL